jgi:hypothetical protein
MFLFVVSFFLVPGWVILFELGGSLWIKSAWPLHSWVDPAYPTAVYVTVAAFWAALVLQARDYLGLAEQTGSSSAFGHWSVERSCTVFGLVNFAAWIVYVFLLNLVLAATSLELWSEPLAWEPFAELQIAISVTLAFAIAVPNYGYLVLASAKQVGSSLKRGLTDERDRRLLGKHAGRRDVGVKPLRPETGRSFRAPSSVIPVQSALGSKGTAGRPLPTPGFSPDYWFQNRGAFPGSVTGMPQPMVAASQEECIVCGKGLAAGEKVLQCPHCSARAHERHFLKWLRHNAGCPRCRTPLSPYDLVEN